MESCPEEKELEMLVARKTKGTGPGSGIVWPARPGQWLSPMLSTDAATPRIPCPVLGPSQQNRHWGAGVCPGKDLGGIFQPKLFCDTFLDASSLIRDKYLWSQGRVKAQCWEWSLYSKSIYYAFQRVVGTHNEHVEEGLWVIWQKKLRTKWLRWAGRWWVFHNPNLQACVSCLAFSPVLCPLMKALCRNVKSLITFVQDWMRLVDVEWCQTATGL